MRLCRDCKHAVITTAGRMVDCRCHHPRGMRLDPPDYVTGKPAKRVPGNAQYLRDDEDRCGPGGKWWQPIEAKAE
jgi:hypothetical protein